MVPLGGFLLLEQKKTVREHHFASISSWRARWNRTGEPDGPIGLLKQVLRQP